MKRCSKCVMPETWAGIKFDEQGICNICREHEKALKIDWEKRQEILKQILKKYKERAEIKGNKYDCIVGYSGGKDSAYTLWALVKKYDMNPLVVTFDHGFPLSPEAEYNLMEIPKKLDCDHLRFTLGNGLRNSLCKKGSEVNGDFCWHCHNGIGAFPARISGLFDIPLQIWGEPTATIYKTLTNDYNYDDFEEQNKEHYKQIFQAGITPEKMEQGEYRSKDFLPMIWPKNDFELKAIYLGNFERWEQRKQVEIITRELGWKHYNVEGTYVDWDKVDCPFEPVRDWQKFMKRGFGRTCFQASKDVRDGLITREKALELIEQYDGKRPFILDSFLKEVKITEEEFNEITKKHIVKREENSNKIVSIIQARMNSERFPNKVLEKINGEPMISFVLNQVNKSKLIDKIVVASTLNPKDELLIEKIKDYGYDVFAGSENDVLDRYYQAAKKFGAKIIVRITADCPLIDPQIIDKVIKKFQETDCDYCSNIQPPTFPDGLDVEVFSFEALERAWKEAKLISEREHVTHYLWKNKDKFKISNLENEEDLSKMRFTVDEVEDIVLINNIVRKIDKRPIHLEDITKVIKINPDLLEINNQYKRNEGWERSFEADKKMKEGGTVI